MGALGAGDDLPRLELAGAGGRAAPDERRAGLEVVPGGDGSEEVDVLVGPQEPLVPVGADRDLGGEVAEQLHAVGAGYEAAAVVDVLCADAHAQRREDLAFAHHCPPRASTSTATARAPSRSTASGFSSISTASPSRTASPRATSTAHDDGRTSPAPRRRLAERAPEQPACVVERARREVADREAGLLGERAADAERRARAELRVERDVDEQLEVGRHLLRELEAAAARDRRHPFATARRRPGATRARRRRPPRGVPGRRP